MRELVIDRFTWLCGKRAWVMHEDGAKMNISTLRLPGGARCCLGFAAEQLCEAEIEDINLKASPAETNLVWPKGFIVAGFGLTKDSESTSSLMQINDECEFSHAQREEKIAAGFATLNVRVTYINDYPSELFDE